MSHLQLISRVVQKHLAGEQETHWDKTNKELPSSKTFFVCLVPVHFFLTSKVFLYHVTDQLQRAHLCVMSNNILNLFPLDFTVHNNIISIGDGSSSMTAPQIWNSLPTSIRKSSTVNHF